MGVVVEVDFGPGDGVLDWAVVGGVVEDGGVCVGVQLTNINPKNSVAYRIEGGIMKSSTPKKYQGLTCHSSS